MTKRATKIKKSFHPIKDEKTKLPWYHLCLQAMSDLYTRLFDNGQYYRLLLLVYPKIFKGAAPRATSEVIIPWEILSIHSLSLRPYFVLFPITAFIFRLCIIFYLFLSLKANFINVLLIHPLLKAVKNDVMLRNSCD